MKAKATSFAFTALVLSTCQPPEMLVVPLSQQVPASLLTCLPRPVPGRADRQSDVARYIVDLDRAGADCRSKVQALDQLVEADTAIAEGEKP